MRTRWVILGLATLLVLAVAFVPHPAFAPRQERFPADLVRAIDADTIAIGNRSIRFDGIAAPEEGHPAHLPGRLALGTLIRNAEWIDCTLGRRESHGRDIGGCRAVTAGATVDLQEAMVGGGHARACPGYGTWRYLRFENRASLALPFPRYCWPGKRLPPP